MNDNFVNLTLKNLDNEHICCAISGPNHQQGVETKKQWLHDRIKEGHVFRKLNERGKVFIEYAPLESSWVPVEGDNYLYIYCLWVSGSFKGKGYANELLNYCIKDAKKQHKSGICILSSKKKKPYMSDKKFMIKYGFEVVDTIGKDDELLALSFDGTKPRFMEEARKQTIDETQLTIYYGLQCPFIPTSISQIKAYCEENQINVSLLPIDTLEKAKQVPCIFNNWAIFYEGEFKSVTIMNASMIKKLIES